MIPVFIYCEKCRTNLVTEFPDGQAWSFEDGKRRCEKCKSVIQIDHIMNDLRWHEGLAAIEDEREGMVGE